MASPQSARRQIAQEAARLLAAHPELSWAQATFEAARNLFPAGFPERYLPLREEVCRAMTLRARDASEVCWGDRFLRYTELLRPLADVQQDPETHPEGDVLYHSLQVFVLAEEALPYDEEFLTAALLHDVGKAIDRREPVAATLTALEGLVTPRTAWLIEHLPTAHAQWSGSLGVRAIRRLNAHDDHEELTLLAECDRGGRCPGVDVPEIEQAIERLIELGEADEGLGMAS